MKRAVWVVERRLNGRWVPITSYSLRWVARKILSFDHQFDGRQPGRIRKYIPAEKGEK